MVFGLSLEWSEFADIVQRAVQITFIQIKANKCGLQISREPLFCNYTVLNESYHLPLTAIKFNYLKPPFDYCGFKWTNFFSRQITSCTNNWTFCRCQVPELPLFLPGRHCALTSFLSRSDWLVHRTRSLRILSYHRPALAEFNATDCCQLKGRHFFDNRTKGNQHCLLIYVQSIMLPLLNPIISHCSQWKWVRELEWHIDIEMWTLLNSQTALERYFISRFLLQFI